jgi:hypothetical protein
MEDSTENMVEISAEELEKLRADAARSAEGDKATRQLLADRAGLDSSNPVTELVMDKHFKSDMTVEQLQELGGKFGILKVEETPKNETPTTPDPNEVLGGKSLTQEISNLDQNRQPDGHEEKPLDEKMRQVYRERLEKGDPVDKAEVAALSMLFVDNRVNAARRRAELQREDEELLRSYPES